MMAKNQEEVSKVTSSQVNSTKVDSPITFSTIIKEIQLKVSISEEAILCLIFPLHPLTRLLEVKAKATRWVVVEEAQE